jgi:hypothetical protein
MKLGVLLLIAFLSFGVQAQVRTGGGGGPDSDYLPDSNLKRFYQWIHVSEKLLKKCFNRNDQIQNLIDLKFILLSLETHQFQQSGCGDEKKEQAFKCFYHQKHVQFIQPALYDYAAVKEYFERLGIDQKADQQSVIDFYTSQIKRYNPRSE